MKQSIAIALGLIALAITAQSAVASSHREAPFVTEHPKVDGTDFYMFRSYEPGREGYVTLIANYLPLQDAYGGPNYFTLDPSARYRINIENSGDAVEDLVFEFSFLNINNRGALDIGGVMVEHPFRTAAQLNPGVEPNEAELYLVRVRRGKGPEEFAVNGQIDSIFFAKALDNFGAKSIPDYEGMAANRRVPIQIPGCDDGRVFVGQRKESFAVNLGEVFDLVNLNPLGDPAAKRSATVDKNVTSIALELPIDCLTGGGGDVIGGWTTALLPRTSVLSDDPTYDVPATESGEWVQVSRLGMPLVNEVVIGLGDKNKFNASRPKDDLANFANYVTNPTLPAVLEVLFGVRAPSNLPRADLVATFVTGFEGVNALGVGEMVRLNTAIPPTPKADQHYLGVVGGDLAGFPNGRRPGDDVVDVALRVVMGGLCHPIAALGGLDLGLCSPADAPDGLLAYTDQTYQGPDQFDDLFPYLRTPLAGSPNAYRTFSANLTGPQEVPPVNSPATGACGAVLNAEGTELAISCSHTLASAVAAHIHGAPAGTAGPILCSMVDATSPIQAVCPLDAGMLEAVQRGNSYVNLHSPAYPGGEIRGQLE
ncbi:MAG: DUF4331 family protein [Thermoanaerobaculia bacterium]|nr:DUF4331 family protein [Thermoanaerobaculia bacterium]